MSDQLIKDLREIEDDCISMGRGDKADAVASAIARIESRDMTIAELREVIHNQNQVMLRESEQAQITIETLRNAKAALSPPAAVDATYPSSQLRCRSL